MQVRLSNLKTSAKRLAGFTLLEVVLAIVIAIGILVVALYFYSQAADLRSQLLLESERIASVRLIMDRITADLRCAYGTFSSGGGVSGGPVSLRIVKTELPSRSSWTGGQLGRAAAAETDLRFVNYSASVSMEGTNLVVSGLMRTEEALVQKRQLPESSRSREITSEPPRVRRPDPLTEVIHFIRFRYWDGSSWQESWSGTDLPQGVEVNLGADPLPEGLLPEEYPFELFRRVIFVPAGQPGSDEAPIFSEEEDVWSWEEGLP